VLLLLAAALLAGLARALYVFFVVRPRRDEEDYDAPSMESQYSEGVNF
jgi:hypothetical protein